MTRIKVTCTRCNGAGKVAWAMHYANGTCFICYGEGVETVSTTNAAVRNVTEGWVGSVFTSPGGEVSADMSELAFRSRRELLGAIALHLETVKFERERANAALWAIATVCYVMGDRVVTDRAMAAAGFGHAQRLAEMIAFIASTRPVVAAA